MKTNILFQLEEDQAESFDIALRSNGVKNRSYVLRKFVSAYIMGGIYSLPSFDMVKGPNGPKSQEKEAKTNDSARDYVTINFIGKPSEEELGRVKRAGFRYLGRKYGNTWKASANEEASKLAEHYKGLRLDYAASIAVILEDGGEGQDCYCLQFEERPNENIITELKEAGYKWLGGSRAWKADKTPESRQAFEAYRPANKTTNK